MIKWIGVIIFGALMIGNASGATLTVNASGGADYTRIQDAINAANNSDTITVAAGTYNENVVVNKSVNLVGAGEGVTIVKAFNPNDHVFYVIANSVNISGFKVKNATNSKAGIYLSSGVSYSNVFNNNATNNSLGIYLSYSNNNRVSDNIANSNNYAGIYLVSSSNNRLSGNIASNNNQAGIYLQSSSNNNILSSNNASNNNNGNSALGIYIAGSSNNTLTGNDVSNNNFGISLASSNDNTLIGNIALNNYYGITLESSNNNILRSNYASNNSYDGIYLFISSINNTIYNNYFNNTNNFAAGMNSNYWNTTKTLSTNIIGGPSLGGNFWANPSGTGFSQTCADANRDGICDSAYVLDANNTDYLPLSLNFTTAIPSASTIGYSATVATGQNTYVQSSNGSFGLLLKGQSKTINNSVVLNNTGDLSAKVEARFNDSRSGVFGLVSGANVLNATNFALGIPSALMPLSNLGANVQVTVAPPGVTALDARLGVPNEQVAGDYSGTVVLTFSNNV